MEQVEIINSKGEAVSNFSLNAAIWQTPLSTWNLSLANRYYLANQAQGTSKVKTRGEVAGSTRKIYRQKGTGSARHGHRYAPQFRGGGVAFGPRGEESHHSLNKKERILAMRVILAEKRRKGKISLFNEIIFDNFKTKVAVEFLKNLPSFSAKEKAVIILAEKEKNKLEKIRVFRNLPTVSLTDSRQVNFSDLFNNSRVIFSCEEAITELEKRLI